MSKKNKFATTYAGLGDADPLRLVTNHVSKKGKIRGNKKEKRAMKNICQHHIITKKGKVKATIEQDGKGNCRCYLCGDIIPMKFANDSEIIKTTNNLYKYVSQAKLMAQSIGAGKKAIHQVTDTATLVRMFPKLYINLRNVTEKQDKAKKQKKKKYNNSSNNYGGWGTRR